MKTRKEKIQCPECDHVQMAVVEELWPWDNYTHECTKCGYIIMESEWNEVE